MPIDVTEGGMLITVSDVHPLKAPIPIDVTDGGITMLASDVHP